MPKMSGARAFAEMMNGYGVSHIFFVPAIMAKALAEMEDMRIRRVVAHGEKAAAYMADGFARASGKPGVCMAQCIGASNLAAGLRDAYRACSPVIAITGGTLPSAWTPRSKGGDMGCREVTKKFLKGLIEVFTPPLIQYAVTAVEVMAAAGKNNPDVLTNETKRAAAAAAIKERCRAMTGVEPRDHLVYLLLEYALAVQKSEYDHTQLGVDDSADEPVGG